MKGLAPPGGGPEAPGIRVGRGPVRAVGPAPGSGAVAASALAASARAASARAASARAASARAASARAASIRAVSTRMASARRASALASSVRDAPAPARVPLPFPVGSAARPLGCWAA
jgi:hypothetical protein